MIADLFGLGKARSYRVAVDARLWRRGQPYSKNVQAGDTVQLDVVSTGILSLAYQWYGPNGVVTNDIRISGALRQAF